VAWCPSFTGSGHACHTKQHRIICHRPLLKTLKAVWPLFQKAGRRRDFFNFDFDFDFDNDFDLDLD
jgi:hypothetical protein